MMTSQTSNQNLPNIFSIRLSLFIVFLNLESDEGDVEDNRIPSIASSRSNMSEQSVDAASPGGNPRISAPLQNTSLGAGAGLANTILKPKSHQESKLIHCLYVL